MNKALLLGNLGKPAELKYTKESNPVLSWSLATTEKWKNAQGEKQESVEWHNCKMFGKTAELIANFMRKGIKVMVEGKIKTRKWEDKDGITKYITEIIVDKVEFVGSNKNDNTDNADNNAESTTQPKIANNSPLQKPLDKATANMAQNAFPGAKTYQYDVDELPF